MNSYSELCDKIHVQVESEINNSISTKFSASECERTTALSSQLPY